MKLRMVCIGALVAAGMLDLDGCRPSDVLTVPPPVGVIGSTTLENTAGAESELTGATAQLYLGLAGDAELIELAGVMTDEFTCSSFNRSGCPANIDARYTAAVASGIYYEAGDEPLERVLAARSALLVAASGLRQYEPASGRSKVGLAYALVGYAELFVAEDYCAGVPLDAITPGGGFQYGVPLTSDSLLATAEAHFDSAMAHAASNDTVIALASVGLGRARLDRGHFATAASAVAKVPIGFTYGTIDATKFGAGSINLYEYQLPGIAGCGYFNTSDREGGNGLNFISAGDPRLVIDSTTEQTCDGGTWYYPIKFGNPSTTVPFATGVEARLIAAEAALHGGDVSTWTADLNALRAAAPRTYLAMSSGMNALTADSTTTASAALQVDVMFRERAFWLYGTGTRLGDLRRLVRQYGRDQRSVFPTGSYANGHNSNLTAPLPTYGADVSFTLPTAAGAATSSQNPNYKGCLKSPGTA